MLMFCNVAIRMQDGSVGRHADWYSGSNAAYDRAEAMFPQAAGISVTIDRSKVHPHAHTCLELGVCQAHTPRCPDCEDSAPLRLAPGVIEGPYKRKLRLRELARKVRKSIGPLAAWLMGPHP